MNNLVTIVNNQVTTTSNQVSETFNKPHKDVLKAIRSLEVPKDFIERNFSLNEYTDKIGRKLPAYSITFDGFTILAMGYTGKKAMKFKVDYIKAFRAMEAKLKAICIAPETTVREHTRSLPSCKKEIVLSDKAKAEIGGITKAVITKSLDERLSQCFSQPHKLHYDTISKAFDSTTEEMIAEKQQERKQYMLSEAEVDIIEKIRSANAFNMLKMYMGVTDKLSFR